MFADDECRRSLSTVAVCVDDRPEIPEEREHKRATSLEPAGRCEISSHGAELQSRGAKSSLHCLPEPGNDRARARASNGCGA